MVEECSARNTGSCAIRACIIEGWFVVSIFQSFLSGNQHSQVYLHSHGFDAQAQCNPIVTGIASSKSWGVCRLPWPTWAMRGGVAYWQRARLTPGHMTPNF